MNIEYNIDLDKGFLGAINFKNNLISIDNEQCATFARTRFTIAHEIGHFALNHSRYMDREKLNIDNVLNIENPNVMGIDDISRMEWQANQFASYLLLPKENFLKDFYIEIRKHQIQDKGFGLIYLDRQQCNIDTFAKISSPLMQKYKVSRSVIFIRLKKLGLANGNLSI